MREFVSMVCLGSFLASFIAEPAIAFCLEPTAPDAPSTSWRPDKPTTPYCYDTFTQTHTCDSWEIDSYNDAVRNYNSEVEEYIDKLKTYAQEAATFADEAVDYGNCEIRNLD